VLIADNSAIYTIFVSLFNAIIVLHFFT